MELFRVNRDPYGQETLAGLSWDLLWVFVAAGLAIVLVHALWAALSGRRARDRAEGGEGA
ncbi:MAG TPA: hypothetical protein VLL72_03425 [Kiloniellales bacterium]|nr:hypothetical protein [Kiloniellales bacterium]